MTIPTHPELTNDEREELRQFLIDHTTNKLGVNFLAIDKNLKVMKSFYERPCYGGLKSFTGSIDTDYICALTGNHTTISEMPDAVRFWMDYVLNRSPYRFAYVVNDLDDAMEHGVVVSTDFPSNYVVGSLMAWKEGWRYSHICKMFKFLVDRGMDEDLAFIYSGIFGNYFSPQYNINYLIESHPVDHFTAEYGLENFKNADIQFETSKFKVDSLYRGERGYKNCNNATSYTPFESKVSSMFLDDEGISRASQCFIKRRNDILYDVCLSFYELGGKTYVNPFKYTGTVDTKLVSDKSIYKSPEKLFSVMHKHYPEYCPEKPITV